MNMNKYYQIRRYLDNIKHSSDDIMRDLNFVNQTIDCILSDDNTNLSTCRNMFKLIQLYNSKIEMNCKTIADSSYIEIRDELDEIIENDNSMIFSSGKYYIGDLCYVEFKHNQFYEHKTEYGDGVLTDSLGRKYWIDSASIGVVNFDTIKITAENITDGNGYSIFEAYSPFKIKYDNTKLVFIRLDDKFNELNELFRISLE